LRNGIKILSIIIIIDRFASLDVFPTWSTSYTQTWDNTLSNMQTLRKVLNKVKENLSREETISLFFFV